MVVVPSGFLGPFSGITPSSPSARMDAGAPLSPDTQRGAANIYQASLPRCSPTAPNTRRATCGATAAPRGTSLLSAELTARRDGAEGSGWGAAPSAGGEGKGEARLHQSHSEKGRRAAAPLLLAGIRAKHLLPALSSRSCEEAGAQPAPECSRAGAGTSASRAMRQPRSQHQRLMLRLRSVPTSRAMDVWMLTPQWDATTPPPLPSDK